MRLRVTEISYTALPAKTRLIAAKPTFIAHIPRNYRAPAHQMFMATGFCSSKEWVFLHLSMANWSALCFFAFLLAAAWLARGAARN